LGNLPAGSQYTFKNMVNVVAQDCRRCISSIFLCLVYMNFSTGMLLLFFKILMSYSTAKIISYTTGGNFWPLSTDHMTEKQVSGGCSVNLFLLHVGLLLKWTG
jgi:hypothetical protein